MNLPNNNPTIVTACLESRGIGWSPESIPGRGTEIPSVTIILYDGLAITGRIQYSDGTSAADQRLCVYATIDGYRYRRHFTAGQDGGFRFFPLPAALYDVSVRPVGVSGNAGPAHDEILIDGVPGGTENLCLELAAGTRLVIELKDAQSAPVTLVPELSFTQRVRRDPSKSDTRLCFYRWYGKVDNIAPGVFGFRDIVPGTFDLGIDVDGFASKKVKDIVVPQLPGEAHVSVTLDAKRQITGTVRWPDGKPATGVRVSWELHRGDDQSVRSRHVCFDGLGVRVRPDRSQGTAMLADKRGAFAFRNLEKSGRYHFYLAVDGREIYTPPPVHVTTDNPQVDLHLTLPAADGGIEGCVFTGGKPLAGALVVAYNGEDLFRRVRTGEDGGYAITGLLDALALPPRPTSADNHLRWVGIDDNPDAAKPKRPEPFSALISDAATVRLDLHIDDPWNGTVAGVVDFGGLPLPVDMKVLLRPDRKAPGSRCADRP